MWNHPGDALTAQMNRTLANNTALAQSYLQQPPVGTGLQAALDVATRAVDARKAEVQDDSTLSKILLRGLQSQGVNLQSASDVSALLAGPATPATKSIALAREGLTSRADAMRVVSPRLLGYLAAQEQNLQLIENTTQTSALALAQRATLTQALNLGVTIPTAPTILPRAPSAALHDLMDAHDVPRTAALDAELATLDALPTQTRDALARTVDSFAAFEDATYDAFAAGDQEMLQSYLLANDVIVNADAGGERMPHPDRAPALDWNGLAAAGVDVGPILATRATFLSAADALRTALASSTATVSMTCAPIDPDPDPVTGVVLFSIDLVDCPNAYTRNTVLTIDRAGRDNYTNNAGGSRLLNDCREPGRTTDPATGLPVVQPPGVAALIDYAGDDERYGAPCGHAGGASLGAGVLLDYGGNDWYVANKEPIPQAPAADGEGVNGGGHAGVGLLVDMGGLDHYIAGAYGVNGGSLVGMGMLIDTGGAEDHYVASFGGVNGGADIGAAFLYDDGGADEYTSDARAGNGGAIGGTALLVDGGGNDVYTSTAMSRERYATSTIGGAHYGAAALYDKGGDDWYYGLRDGSVGGGVDGVGLLIDVDGVDHYKASYNGTIGSGWSIQPTVNCQIHTNNMTSLMDLSFILPGGLGMLIEMNGGDFYDGASFATVGGAYIGASFFVDAAGDDHYFAHDGGGAVGGAGGHNKGLGVAFLYDGGGVDHYTTAAEYNGDKYFCPAVDTPEYEFFGKGSNGGGAHAGAVGFLLDAGSSGDFYTAESNGVNGGATDAAIGMLIDIGGDDTYTAKHRGVNGGAYGGGGKFGWEPDAQDTFAMGFLIDVAGNDKYYAGGVFTPNDRVGHGVNGGAVRAMGFLYDGAGTDRYEAWGTATNGGGASGIGFLFDGFVSGATNYLAMSDTYYSYSPQGEGHLEASNGAVRDWTCVTACAVGFSTTRDWYREYVPGGIGLLLDFGGSNDDYGDPEPTEYSGDGPNKCKWPKGEPGLGQQRDYAAVDNHPSLENNCPTAPPTPLG